LVPAVAGEVPDKIRMRSGINVTRAAFMPALLSESSRLQEVTCQPPFSLKP